ncbi:MAG TPA: TolC family protein [Gemmatimonadaceae bacterium]|nr:TolC family protein [Gemmatimonadaceae bacterium]
MRTFILPVVVVSAAFPLARPLGAQQPVPAAQLSEAGPARPIELHEFLEIVGHANPDYAAQRSAVEIARGQVDVARLFPNPVLSAGYLGDITGQHMPSVVTPSLTQAFLLGGKIGAREEAANAAYSQVMAQYADFGRTLRAAAAGAYVDAMVAQMGAERRRQSAEAVDRLAAANLARFQAGDIGEADMLQSRVEELRFRADYLAAESVRRVALLALSAFMGARGDTLFVPTPYRLAAPQVWRVEALIDSALSRRPDVLAAQRATDVARAQTKVAHADRVTDVAVGVNYQYATQSTNIIAPSPTWQALGASISLPIPLTNAVNRGELEVAEATLTQSQYVLQAVQIRAQNEVRQAYARYTLAAERLGAYSGELLADAERVLSARTYSYQRGAAPLTDVLIAQQAVNDVYLAYYDALGEFLKATVGLQLAAGLTDIGF